MWSPSDKSAVPTLEELKRAKGAIKLVQRDLESAMVTLAQAQLRVEALKKDLEERIAWIAPVRKLTFDVLSTIFDWSGEIEWDSPIRIAAVCRTWRIAVLETPRAWSFACLKSKMTAEAINMFLERSRERRLHIYVSGSWRFDLSPVAHRIHCLSLDYLLSVPHTLKFPNLQRLSISRDPMGIPIGDINARRFPALLHLVTLVTPLSHARVPFDKDLSFPQLKSWGLCISRNLVWLDGLRSCQNTLVSLELAISRGSIADKQPLILLPVLVCLVISASAVLRQGILNFKTPILESYEEHCTDKQGVLEGPIHTDVSTVSQIRFMTDGMLSMSLAYCQGVQKLQIYGGGSSAITSVLDQLSVDREICPMLREIDLLVPEVDVDTDEYSTRLTEISSCRVHPIEITALAEWPDLPGAIQISCGDTMPCTDQ